MALEAQGLSFCYPGERALVIDGFSLTIAPGERVGLMAPSGRGKTTLCALLAGYEKPLHGQVLVEGKPLASLRGYCPVQMVWQHPELAVNPRMRMRDVLAEGDGVDARILTALGIEPGWLARFPSEVSGGELQRFCVARALGRGTRYLLADEIGAMLDLITQSQLFRFLMEETKRRNIGLLAVSHSEPLLRSVCGRIVRLP